MGDDARVAASRRSGSASYRALLERLSRWFESGRAAAGAVVPCRAGCTACCHGPFDISVADLELLTEAVAALPAESRAEVLRRAKLLLGRMEALEPEWTAPYAVADLGDERFDRLSDALAAEPCPLLDDAGRCRIYADRPLVCRLIGLPMRSPAGRVIANACPIQDRFPGYPELAPIPFDLEDLEAEEIQCLQGAARRVLGDVSRYDFETTISTAIVTRAAT